MTAEDPCTRGDDPLEAVHIEALAGELRRAALRLACAICDQASAGTGEALVGLADLGGFALWALEAAIEDVVELSSRTAPSQATARLEVSSRTMVAP